MRHSWIALSLILIAAPASSQVFTQTCPTPSFPAGAVGIDSSCQISGSSSPQSADGLQNIAKNDFCAVGTPATVTAASLKTLQTQAAAAEKKNKITAGQAPASRAFLTALGEGALVTFEGYVFEARQECKESVNCNSQSPNTDGYHDLHISLLDKPPTSKGGSSTAQDVEECGSFVAEMVPHHRPPEWNACNVNDVANQKLRVRVSGHQMFDASHLTCNGTKPVGTNPKRQTLWEIHPIYSFDVCPSGDCTSGGWVSLATFAAGKTTCQNLPCQN